MLKIPSKDSYGRPLENYAARAKELRKFITLTQNDLDTLQFFFNYKKYIDEVPCPFPLENVDDFFEIIVRCVKIGVRAENIQKNFSLIMMTLNLMRFRYYKTMPGEKFSPFLYMFNPEKLIPHYESVIGELTHRLKFLDDGGGKVFSWAFLHNLTSKRLNFMIPDYLCHLYGAVLTGKRSKLSEGTKDFIRSRENFVVLSSEFKIYQMAKEYERAIQDFKEKMEIAKLRQDPELTETNFIELKRINSDLKKTIQKKKQKKIAEIQKFRVEREQLEIELLDERSKHKEEVGQLESEVERLTKEKK